MKVGDTVTVYDWALDESGRYTPGRVYFGEVTGFDADTVRVLLGNDVWLESMHIWKDDVDPQAWRQGESSVRPTQSINTLNEYGADTIDIHAVRGGNPNQRDRNERNFEGLTFRDWLNAAGVEEGPWKPGRYSSAEYIAWEIGENPRAYVQRDKPMYFTMERLNELAEQTAPKGVPAGALIVGTLALGLIGAAAYYYYAPASNAAPALPPKPGPLPAAAVAAMHTVAPGVSNFAAPVHAAPVAPVTHVAAAPAVAAVKAPKVPAPHQAAPQAFTPAPPAQTQAQRDADEAAWNAASAQAAQDYPVGPTPTDDSSSTDTSTGTSTDWSSGPAGTPVATDPAGNPIVTTSDPNVYQSTDSTS